MNFMKVILLKDVAGVGQKGSLKEVADGYAVNNLIPSKSAVMATPEKLAQLKQEQTKHSAEQQKKESLWEEQKRLLRGAQVTVRIDANPKGQLYRQLPSSTVASRIAKEIGVNVPAEDISFKEPIKSLGRSEAYVHLGREKVPVTVFVERED
jgi:large subunit ribosomal protein L9